MLFEEFIEQHRVHCVVADGLEVAIVIAFDQIRSCLLHFLSDKAKLRNTIWIKLLLITEGYCF